MEKTIKFINIPGKFLVVGGFVLAFLLSGCGESQPKLKLETQTVQMPKDLPEGSITSTVPPVTPVETQVAQAPEPAKPEEGSYGKIEDHPVVAPGEVHEREIQIPADVEGKWRAVKILIANKKDEAKNQIKTVELGTTFGLDDAGLKVSVGPFLPNFVMDKGTYSSMNNEMINPAVYLVVEEKGKTIYKGWAFARFPSLYAFEHEEYKLELLDSIPAGVS